MGGDVVDQLALDLLADDEDDAVKARREGVLGGVVHERLAIGPYLHQLFQTAETTAMACCENDELHARSLRPPNIAVVRVDDGAEHERGTKLDDDTNDTAPAPFADAVAVSVEISVRLFGHESRRRGACPAQGGARGAPRAHAPGGPGRRR